MSLGDSDGGGVTAMWDRETVLQNAGTSRSCVNGKKPTIF